MSEERETNKQKILARKIALTQGIVNINRLILILRREEQREPVFQQYLKEREINIETTIQGWEREIK